MSVWKIHHRAETASTNLDARAGAPGDVFTADFQTAGRGRLDHKWLSPPGTNLMMSAVLDVAGLLPEHVSTLPLVVGLAVARALRAYGVSPQLKWPNDVLIDGRKVAGVLCERAGDAVIAGIGVNVGKQVFPPEIAARATCLEGRAMVSEVRDAILRELTSAVAVWRERGFTTLHSELAPLDFLRGRILTVRQTDDDSAPICGLCHGIMCDGTLRVGEESVYAGEAHVEGIGE